MRRKDIFVGVIKGFVFAFAMYIVVSIIKNDKKRVRFSNNNKTFFIPTNYEQSEYKNDLYYSKHELNIFSIENQTYNNIF